MPRPIRIYKIKPNIGRTFTTNNHDHVDDVLFRSLKIITSDSMILIKKITVLTCVLINVKIASKILIML